MKIAICDDNVVHSEILLEYFNRIDESDCDVFDDGESLILKYENNEADYDVVFLDIEMKSSNGIDTGIKIRNKDRTVIIIFVTNHEEYAVESFECEPLSFIVKPVTFEKFESVVNKVKEKVQSGRRLVSFKCDMGTLCLYDSDIIFIESQKHNVLLHTKDGKTYKIRESISNIPKILGKEKFVKTHRAYIVNMDYVKSYDDRIIHFYDTDKTVLISRGMQKSFKENLLNFVRRKFI